MEDPNRISCCAEALEASTCPAPSLQSQKSHAKKKCPFFEELPPEIRYQVLRLAFGDRTIHMNLPRYPVLSEIGGQSGSHCSNLSLGPGIPGCIDDSTSKSSQSCAELQPLRRHRYAECHDYYEEDISNQCSASRQLGVFGWLQSCRRAYYETAGILYGTNNIIISSSYLHRNLGSVLTPNTLIRIVSLELNLDPEIMDPTYAFRTAPAKDKQPESPLFPSLQYLRVSFKQLAHDETDGVTFMAPGTHMGHRVERELHHRLFPKIDALVDRVAPLETEVMVSCRSWGWYKHVDLYLLERQGLEVTKPQTSGNQGIKCWREHPSRLPQWQQEEELVQQASHLPFTPRIIRSRLKPPVGSLRKGYWIHIPWYKIQSPGLIEHNYLERLDGRRRNLYSADISNLAIQNTAS